MKLKVSNNLWAYLYSADSKIAASNNLEFLNVQTWKCSLTCSGVLTLGNQKLSPSTHLKWIVALASADPVLNNRPLVNIDAWLGILEGILHVSKTGKSGKEVKMRKKKLLHII
jgi:hypothetical protein